MKYIFTVMVVAFATNLFAQIEDGETLIARLELFLGFENVPLNCNDSFFMTAKSTVWECPLSSPYAGFFSISNNQSIYNSQYLWDIVEESNNKHWLGWNIVYDNNDWVGPQHNPRVPPFFGYGLYKISTTAGSTCFYIDYRDHRLKPYQGNTNGHNVDLWIKYNFLTGKFYYSSSGDYQPNSFIEIEDNSILRFWDIKEVGLPSTSEFPFFWENSLSLIDDGLGHPKLVWSSHPESGVIGYKVLKRKSQSVFSEVMSVQSNQLEYTDFEELLPTFNPHSPIVDVEYKVVGVLSNNNTTGASNIVSTYVIGNPYKEGASQLISGESARFDLSQNYPNPFNPITIIDYSLKEQGFVVLSVFNSLGEKILTLRDEEQGVGNYSVSLNLSEYPSGIYYYTLISGADAVSKKLILLK